MNMKTILSVGAATLCSAVFATGAVESSNVVG